MTHTNFLLLAEHCSQRRWGPLSDLPGHRAALHRPWILMIPTCYFKPCNRMNLLSICVRKLEDLSFWLCDKKNQPREVGC